MRYEREKEKERERAGERERQRERETGRNKIINVINVMQSLIKTKQKMYTYLSLYRG
jgi:hypothetical protein